MSLLPASQPRKGGVEGVALLAMVAAESTAEIDRLLNRVGGIPGVNGGSIDDRAGTVKEQPFTMRAALTCFSGAPSGRSLVEPRPLKHST